MDRGEQRMGEANVSAVGLDQAQSSGTLDVRFYGCRVLGRGAELQERRLRKRRDRKQQVLRVAGKASEAAFPQLSETSWNRDGVTLDAMLNQVAGHLEREEPVTARGLGQSDQDTAGELSPHPPLEDLVPCPQ